MSENKKTIWTIKKILDWSKQYFEDNHIEDPQLESQILLGHVLDMNRVQLIIQAARPLDDKELAEYKKLIIKRVKEHLPTAYILGHREFWSFDLEVSPDVLIPRPDTECLVERALTFIQSRINHKPIPWLKDCKEEYTYERLEIRHPDEEQSLEEPEDAGEPVQTEDSIENPEPVSPLHIIDVGTGSGAIILALASELRERCKYTAVDVSEPALEVSGKNAEKLGLDVQFIKSDLLNEITEKADLIVSNPPYISDEEMKHLAPEVLREPEIALRAGQEGLDIYKRLIPQAVQKLNPGGALMVEIGCSQSSAVEELFRKAGFRYVQTFKDYGHRPRVVFGVCE